MPLNLVKIYPQLLEILHLKEDERKKSLDGIYRRDIVNNTDFKFRSKQIYPIKADGEIDMERQFIHLTSKEIEEKDEIRNTIFKRRVFDRDRSERLHWINHHVHEKTKSNINVFTVVERDMRKRTDVTKTYIYDHVKKYVVVLEHQKKDSYYLLTAYFLNEKYAEKQMKNKMKKRIDE